MKEFKSFYKTVEGNEGQKCHYPTRLDTYGCGCFHNCKYCYAKSLLEFRELWRPEDPSVADINKIEKVVKKLPKCTVLRLGGMTDCFQPCEVKYKVTYNTIKILNKYGIHYLIVTKSNLIATDEYVKILDKDLAHIQITVTSTNDELAKTYETATPISLRIKAIEKLQELGFDVTIRISPFIPEYMDFDKLNNVKCDKCIVEFLRVNTFIKKSFDLDYSQYSHKEGGYYHLPLKKKKELIGKITGFKQLSVCEDCTEAYEYWHNHINYNPNDCCNLRFSDGNKKYIGDLNILNNKKIGFLSSRMYDKETDNKVINWSTSIEKTACVVSGFQSKIEQVLLRELMKTTQKIVMVLPKGMYDKCPERFEKKVKCGEMLIISSFSVEQQIITKETAKLRNQFIIDTADEIVVGDITNNGMISELLDNKKYKLIGKRI